MKVSEVVSTSQWSSPPDELMLREDEIHVWRASVVKTFAQLAAYYEKHYLKPAEYIEGRKVSGLRSLLGLTAQLDAARAFFGHRTLRSITYADLVSLRSEACSDSRRRHLRPILICALDSGMRRAKFSRYAGATWTSTKA